MAKIDVSKFAKGAIESPFDPRDYALSSVMPVVMRYPDVCPAPFDLTKKNQGQNPSCVPNAASLINQEKKLLQKVSQEYDAEDFYKELKKIKLSGKILGAKNGVIKGNLKSIKTIFHSKPGRLLWIRQ